MSIRRTGYGYPTKPCYKKEAPIASRKTLPKVIKKFGYILNDYFRARHKRFTTPEGDTKLPQLARKHFRAPQPD